MTALAGAAPASGGGPAAYHATYEISVEGKAYSLSFDWSSYDATAWNEGDMFHRETALTDYCFARQLTPKWAVIIRLPQTVINKPSDIPEVLLIEDGSPVIRSYKTPGANEPMDGLFLLTSYTLKATPGRKVTGEMTRAERTLISTVENGHFATLYGDGYSRSQWLQDPDMAARLGALNAPTLLGFPSRFRHPNGPVFQGFNEFRSRFDPGKGDRYPPAKVYYTYRDGTWTESAGRIATYVRGQFLHPSEVFARFTVEHAGLSFSLEEGSLYFDPATGELISVKGRALDDLNSWVFENP